MGIILEAIENNPKIEKTIFVSSCLCLLLYLVVCTSHKSEGIA